MISLSLFTMLKPKVSMSTDLRKEPLKLLESHLRLGPRNVKKQKMLENLLNIGKIDSKHSIKTM